MRLKQCFQIIQVVDEYLVVPVREAIPSFSGMLVVNEETAYLLKHMDEHKTVDELQKLLIEAYEVEPTKGKEDICKMLDKLLAMGILDK